jgi:hypothetical protein
MPRGCCCFMYLILHITSRPIEVQTMHFAAQDWQHAAALVSVRVSDAAIEGTQQHQVCAVPKSVRIVTVEAA